MKSALILVDIQNDFMPGGALAVQEGDAILPIVNRLQQYFSLVVATQDWHPQEHKSFAVNHAAKKIGEVIHWEGLEQMLWPVHCVQNSEGSKFHPDLDQTKIDQIFQKGTDTNIDSYSGFFDNGHVKSTGLADYLRAKAVEDVYIVGLACDYCVKFTVLDALKEGFNTILINDATRAVNIQKDDFEKATTAMQQAGAKIMSSEAVIEQLARSSASKY